LFFSKLANGLIVCGILPTNFSESTTSPDAAASTIAQDQKKSSHFCVLYFQKSNILFVGFVFPDAGRRKKESKFLL